MNKRINSTIVLLLSLLVCGSLTAAVKLPSIVGNGMVLQRDVELKIWGWADPGEPVTVSFRGNQYTTTTDDEGRWQVAMGPLSIGDPASMVISGNDNSVTLEDIRVGDVWVCSGQSNMTHQFNRWQERYAKEIAASENSEIRQFRVPTKPVLSGPLEDIPGLEWKLANPQNLLDFTVIGYFHAKKLYDRYHVPQGIIMTCVGGTRIEAWTSEEGFSEFPEQLETIELNKDAAYVERVNAEAKAAREAAIPVPADKGLTGDLKWYDPAYTPLNWKRINIPGYWEDQGIRDLNGAVWYRREIEIPESMIGKEVKVKLGRIVNADELYVNGEKVGNTTYEYPQRCYTIPAGLLKPGKNLFVIRVVNFYGKGGFVPDKPYCLEAGGQKIDLKGYWEYKVGEVYRPAGSFPQGINAQDQPASLYNGMIAPYINYAVRGILWYQGESNAGNPGPYYQLLPNLIQDWRNKWGLGDIVFLIAQLPNFMEVNYLPEESNWAIMREAELVTAQNTPNTGIGVNIELGEWNDIHPGNKKPVGERLALQAMKLSYGDNDIVASGPVFRSQEIKDGKIVLSFDSVGSGLVSSNGEALAHFAIADNDKKFVWGEAVIEGDEVVVSSEEVPNPKYVRYAWADNPDFANLANKEGLPATPFRTDR